MGGDSVDPHDSWLYSGVYDVLWEPKIVTVILNEVKNPCEGNPVKAMPVEGDGQRDASLHSA